MEVIAFFPATATLAVLFVYLRPVLGTARVDLQVRRWQAPELVYAVEAALHGEPNHLHAVVAYRRDVITRWAIDALNRATDRLNIIEPGDRLAEWWSHHVSYNRELARYSAYVPRHSYELRQHPTTIDQRLEAAGWRLRWAEWDTQFWPCLATEGDAYHTVDVSTSIESYAR